MSAISYRVGISTTKLCVGKLSSKTLKISSKSISNSRSSCFSRRGEKKEMCYEEHIQAFLIKEHLALSNLDYLDQESETLDDLLSESEDTFSRLEPERQKEFVEQFGFFCHQTQKNKENDSNKCTN